MSKEQDLQPELESAQPIPELPAERGSERFTVKTGITWVLGMGASCAVVLYGSGEAMIALRNMGIGMTPMSEVGIQNYRIALGVMSLGAAIYGWAAAKESYK